MMFLNVLNVIYYIAFEPWYVFVIIIMFIIYRLQRLSTELVCLWGVLRELNNMVTMMTLCLVTSTYPSK